MTAPTVARATLRAYNVGFGDCLLLLLDYGDGSRRSILIDFGSTGKPPGAPANHMDRVAGNIKDETRGQLEMVVATHRHSDHISGFGRRRSGQIIADLNPKLVLQPWTEHPDLDTDAHVPVSDDPAIRRLRLVQSLEGMQALAGAAHSEVARLSRLGRLAPEAASRLSFIGETNVSNPAAVKQLQQMGQDHKYVAFGADLDIGDLLPGVTIDVLGPPDLEQAEDIAHQAEAHQEFWHLAAKAFSAGTHPSPRRGRGRDPLFPDVVRSQIPQGAKWLTPRIDRVRTGVLMSLLRIMDNVLNNTSLILLIHIGEASLLFPGDAQIENWSYALFEADNRAAIRRALAKTTVYKVGHHGSLNATPRRCGKASSTRSPASSPAVTRLPRPMSGR